MQTLQSALTTRTSRAGGTDSFVTPYRVEQVHTCMYMHTALTCMHMQAVAARDSMAKALYGALFDWIVNRVS